LYALAGTWLTDWIGRPLVRLNFDQQRDAARLWCARSFRANNCCTSRRTCKSNWGAADTGSVCSDAPRRFGVVALFNKQPW